MAKTTRNRRIAAAPEGIWEVVSDPHHLPRCCFTQGNIAFGELEPSVSFENTKGIYLSEKGEKNIEVKITNVPTVRIAISKIYENNLLASQQFGYEPEQSGGGSDGEYSRSSYESNSMFGDVIYQQDIDTKSLPKMGNSRIFHFNIPDKLQDFKGIYIFRLVH